MKNCSVVLNISKINVVTILLFSVPVGACFVHCVWLIGANQTRSNPSSIPYYDPHMSLGCMNSSSIEQQCQDSSRTKNSKLKESFSQKELQYGHDQCQPREYRCVLPLQDA